MSESPARNKKEKVTNGRINTYRAARERWSSRAIAIERWGVPRAAGRVAAEVLYILAALNAREMEKTLRSYCGASSVGQERRLEGAIPQPRNEA